MKVWGIGARNQEPNSPTRVDRGIEGVWAYFDLAMSWFTTTANLRSASRATETLRRGDSLIRGLSVDPREGKNLIAALVGRHASFSRSLRLNAQALMEPVRRAPAFRSCVLPLARPPRRASPFSSDRRPGRILPPSQSPISRRPPSR